MIHTYLHTYIHRPTYIHTHIHKSFIEKMTERIDLTIRENIDDDALAFAWPPKALALALSYKPRPCCDICDFLQQFLPRDARSASAVLLP